MQGQLKTFEGGQPPSGGTSAADGSPGRSLGGGRPPAAPQRQPLPARTQIICPATKLIKCEGPGRKLKRKLFKLERVYQELINLSLI